MSTDPSPNAEELLAAVLAELTERLRRGETPDLQAAIKQHPHLEVELKELWPAVVMAEEMSRSVDDPRTLPWQTTAEHLPARNFGDYELLEELGRGGMGIVYKAWEKKLDRVVALKMVLSGPWATPEELSRFRAEASVAAKLDHPGIVPVYEIGECEGKPYFSMKHIPGKTLAQIVAQGPLPPRDAAKHMLQMAEAVEHAHQKGILHRDLKPSNVLIDEAGVPHITDFGLAKRADGPSLTATGAVLGTPSYMPPEQAARHRGQLSPASDVYSLGAILYHLLTGRPPFQAATMMDTLMLVLDQDPVPPRLLNPVVDKELEIICLKCLQKAPDLRYQSAAQLAAELRAFLNGEPISAQPRSLVDMLTRLLRPTHHAAVLENWGLVWMWHSLLVLMLCALTQWLKWQGVQSHVTYVLLWGVGLATWAYFFWQLRKREGPITFIERQVAHVWAAGVAGSIALFLVEMLLGLEVLKLSPVLAVMAGMVFTIKAGTLSGSFHLAALLMYLTAGAMALFPQVDQLLFGTVSGFCFFIPGLKYYRQKLRNRRDGKDK
jgi:eukaryotic-like serine/threonine-protein kinase